MPTRNQVKIVIAIAILVCCSGVTTVKANRSPSSQMQPSTYWVVVMWTLIGTQYISDVCFLPVDDNESVAAAANGWGKQKGLMTVESNVYRFKSAGDAEKFRGEKRLLDLQLHTDDLIKFLCVGQPPDPSKDFWVVIMSNSKGTDFISEVCPLPAYDRESIEAAAGHWGVGRGFLRNEGGASRFNSQEEAEEFRRKQKLSPLNLTARILRKYLCADRPRQVEREKQ